MHKDIFNYYDENNKLNKVVDSGIYKDSWFRYPNQTKEGIKNTEHIIEKGKIQDFIVEHIPKNSICIDDYKYIEKTNNKKEKKEKTDKKEKKDKKDLNSNFYSLFIDKELGEIEVKDRKDNN